MLIDQQKHPKNQDQDKNDEAEDDEDKKDSKSPKELPNSFGTVNQRIG